MWDAPSRDARPREGQTRREAGTQSHGPHARQPGHRKGRRVVDRTIGASRHPQAPARRGVAPLVLFALEPRAYSEAISLAVASLREEMQVMAVDPEKLPAVTDFSAPAIVLSSRPMPGDHDGAVRWA